jgi:DNA-binding transcriptional LysR family regulator
MLHILGRFRERYPGVAMVVSSGNSEEVIAKLYDYEAEVGILGEMPEGRDFETIKLSSTPLIAFTNQDHPLSRRKTITLAELAQEMLVLRERGSKTRQSIEAAARSRGLTLQTAIEAEGREAVREIVATGGGVGVVSAAEFGQDPRLVPIRLSDCEVLMDEALVCLRERSGGKVISAFFDTAREVASAR